MNKELTIKERAALLMGLISSSTTSQMPTKDAKEALRILSSLQTNTSKTRGHQKIIKNPVTNTQVTMRQNPSAGAGNDVSFKTGSGYERPSGKPNSPTKLQGIQATLNQMLSEIPIKGSTGDSRYTASPIFDEKDLDRSLSGRGSEGQRAKAYRRMTKGAFSLPPDNDTMRGNRLGESKWQPRGAKSRYAKAVHYDLTDVVKQLGIKGATRAAAQNIPVVGKYLQAYMTAEDMIKGVTGKSPTGEFINQAKRSIKDQSMPRPATLMIR